MAQGRLILKHVGRSLVSGLPLEPPAFVSLPDRKIELPNAAIQKIGFSLESHEDTLEVARTFPTLYKEYIVKGAKKK